MSKLEFWELLYEDRVWHKSTDIRERFDVKQQMTLKNWANVPFVMCLISNRGNKYKFNDHYMEEYTKAIEAEVFVPPIKLNNGKEIPAEIPEREVELFALRFDFPVHQLKGRVELFLKNLNNSPGPEWNSIKETLLTMDKNKLNADHVAKNAAEGLIQTLAFIFKYNTVELEGMKELRESMNPKEPETPMQTIEDIRNETMQDIMKHLPPVEEDHSEFYEYFGKTT